VTMLDSTDQRLPIHAARPACLRELSPFELRCLDIDVELRDVWALLDQLPGRWKKRQLQFFAGALRVSYDRGLTLGSSPVLTKASRKAMSRAMPRESRRPKILRAG
jgi:hypothetical protein